MKKYLLILALMLLPTLASAQTSRNPCYLNGQQSTQGIPSCESVSNTKPLPVTVTGGGGATTVAPNGATTTNSTAAPTALTFSSLLASNTARKACTIQNVGTTLGYIYPAAAGGTVSNAYQVSAGGTFSCVNGVTVLTDAITGTCASGTCAFVVSYQ